MLKEYPDFEQILMLNYFQVLQTPPLSVECGIAFNNTNKPAKNVSTPLRSANPKKPRTFPNPLKFWMKQAQNVFGLLMVVILLTNHQPSAINTELS